ncbi:MAG: inositol monophosphatase, monophosphatase [Candidatus Saccharibacteria bacterium]|nr:inositol monophosphatase, monophosphatase [Candidatus Saccharibacteria bacterium]
MTDTDLQRALEITRAAVVEAGVELKKFYGNIESLSKGDGSSVGGVVTELDRKTEQFLADKLGAFSSEIGFRGEEFGVQSHADTTWLVDPIDGTAHFIRGLPFCTTMVSLIENGVVVMSVIHDFVRDDTYWAIRGRGAYCNDTPISVSNRTLAQSLISFETRVENPQNYEKYLAVRNQASIIATINCGFEFAMIASGKLDGRLGLNPYGMDWDFAPGSLLVSEAGGVATNIGKATYDYQDHDYIITNAVIHAELTSGPDAIFPLS